MGSQNNNTISDFQDNSDDRPTEDPGSSEGSGSLEDVQAKLAAVTADLEAARDKYLRLAAEFENYKRRGQREQGEAIRFANEGLLKEMLPIVDNLERAIRSTKASPTLDGVAQGVDLTLKQFLETLARFGVRPITSVGEPFDPARHQAVSRTAGDAPENSVVEEYQRGYLLHDRVLRPAMVSVSVPEADAGSDDTQDDRDQDKPTRSRSQKGQAR
jgi:molecular chaperone GrpE